MMVFCLLLIFFLILYQALMYRDRNHFEQHGIYYFKNGFYRLFTVVFNFVTIVDAIKMQYHEMKVNNSKIAARSVWQTTLMVTDLEILKRIFIQDFDSFVDRRKFSVPQKDILFNKMLFAYKGEDWKVLRSTMTPAFTAKKIHGMFNFFNTGGIKLVKYVNQQMTDFGEVDLNKGFSKYTMDVVTSAAFGIDCKAFDQEDPSIFELMGNEMLLEFSGITMVKYILMAVAPRAAEFFGVSMFSVDVQKFFISAVNESIKHRKESGRVDFVQLMLNARKGLDNKKKLEEERAVEIFDNSSTEGTRVNIEKLLDNEGIAANCVLFILGGFDTTRSLLLLMSYALAINNEVQQKLRSEIELSLKENGGELTFDIINKMEYMDMVINETLRYYPPAPITDRMCTKEYKIPGTDFILKKGQSIAVPIIGIHHDEQYYPEPEKFIPERFSLENRSKIHPYAFLPFGLGPRNCIGIRFALAEVKIAIIHLIRNFSIEPSRSTSIPMKYENSVPVKPLGGMWLALRPLK